MQSKSNQDKRITIAALGEWYNDLLRVDSWINNRPPSQQAASLLCSKLQEQEARVQQRLEYLAKKRGVKSDELWVDILKSRAEKLDAEDWVEDEEDE